MFFYRIYTNKLLKSVTYNLTMASLFAMINLVGIIPKVVSLIELISKVTQTSESEKIHISSVVVSLI